MERTKRILVAPLDWGLGHATRCIPVINEFLSNNCEVFLASNGKALALLNKEFPELKSVELPGYNPIYPSDNSMVWKMATQLPKFLRTISEEHRITEKIVQENKIDVVISDNRYGCFSNKARSIFVTHQLNIMMPDGWGLLERVVNIINHNQMRKFTECWVPDKEGDKSLAGKLSANPGKLKLQYIGALSRFNRKPADIKYDLLVIASGPEPQKSLFIELMKKQVQAIKPHLKTAWVYGDADTGQKVASARKGDLAYNYLTTNELNDLVAQCNIIISRPGYSSIMDMSKLEKKAIFIPTPGQTEQEYLANELMKKKTAFSMAQSVFNLKKALKETEKFAGFVNFGHDESLLKNAVRSITT